MKRIIYILLGLTLMLASCDNVYINGDLLDEPYVTEQSLGECDVTFPYQVPDNSYFVLGDRRETSIDSRSSVIGCISSDQILGRILCRIWPVSHIDWMS